ncbi:MAG: lipoprotein-releasing ABC transporter permease subunit LolE [Psychrosphaera sp.]|nr:lipoprotein-releasing ABC transporter permease subunit LolE [Psychrosphaera sp.]
MSIKLSFYISQRYRKAKLKNRFISFIALSSTLGIALGVAALIIALSVMNGFQRELVDRLLSIVPHIEYVSVDQPILNWPEKLDKIAEHPQVNAVAPFIPLKGMVQKGETLHGIEIRGVDGAAEQQVSNIHQFMIAGDWSSMSTDKNALILGAGIAQKLNVTVGDHLQVMLPQIDRSFRLKPPKYANLQVTGIFKMGGQLDFSLGYIALNDARDLIGLDEGAIQGIRLNIKDVFVADQLSREIANTMTDTVYMISWFRSQGHLYQDIQLVRFIMYLVLFIVIAVASFNIVSTLVMAVKEKQSDIAILKTMGATDNTIIMTFVFQGLSNGIKGIAFGAVTGILVALYIPNIFVWLEQLRGTRFLEDDVYFINFIPSQLMWQDVVIAVSIALVASLVATIYPSRRATKIEPAVILGQG